jgi:hypothetical protein
MKQFGKPVPTSFDDLDLDPTLQPIFERTYCNVCDASPYHIGLAQVQSNFDPEYHSPNHAVFPQGNRDNSVNGAAMARYLATTRQHATWWEKYYHVEVPKMAVTLAYKKQAYLFAIGDASSNGKDTFMLSALRGLGAMWQDVVPNLDCVTGNIWSRPMSQSSKVMFGARGDLDVGDNLVVTKSTDGVYSIDGETDVIDIVIDPVDHAALSLLVGANEVKVKDTGDEVGDIVTIMYKSTGTEASYALVTIKNPLKHATSSRGLVAKQREYGTGIDSITRCRCKNFDAIELERFSNTAATTACYEAKEKYQCKTCCNNPLAHYEEVGFRTDIV